MLNSLIIVNKLSTPLSLNINNVPVLGANGRAGYVIDLLQFTDLDEINKRRKNLQALIDADSIDVLSNGVQVSNSEELSALTLISFYESQNAASSATPSLLTLTGQAGGSINTGRFLTATSLSGSIPIVSETTSKIIGVSNSSASLGESLTITTSGICSLDCNGTFSAGSYIDVAAGGKGAETTLSGTTYHAIALEGVSGGGIISVFYTGERLVP